MHSFSLGSRLCMILALSSLFWGTIEQIVWVQRLWVIMLWSGAILFLRHQTTNLQKAQIRSYWIVLCIVFLYSAFLFTLKAGNLLLFIIVLSCIISFLRSICPFNQQSLFFWSYKIQKNERIYWSSLLIGCWILYLLLSVSWEQAYFYALTGAFLVFIINMYLFWFKYNDFKHNLFGWLLFLWRIFSWLYFLITSFFFR